MEKKVLFLVFHTIYPINIIMIAISVDEWIMNHQAFCVWMKKSWMISFWHFFRVTAVITTSLSFFNSYIWEPVNMNSQSKSKSSATNWRAFLLCLIAFNSISLSCSMKVIEWPCYTYSQETPNMNPISQQCGFASNLNCDHEYSSISGYNGCIESTYSSLNKFSIVLESIG